VSYDTLYIKWSIDVTAVRLSIQNEKKFSPKREKAEYSIGDASSVAVLIKRSTVKVLKEKHKLEKI
jgi:hypothetical protein